MTGMYVETERDRERQRETQRETERHTVYVCNVRERERDVADDV